MSIPNWWGDYRPGLTPHTGNLQSTDLIECTQIVGGLPVNTAITGQQIINAASGGGGGVRLVTQKNNITTTATSAMQIIAFEEIDDIYIHIFTTEGTTVCIPKDLLDGTI